MIGNHREKDECKGYKKIDAKKKLLQVGEALVEDEKLLKMTNKTS